MEQNKRETGGSGAAPGRSGGYGGVGAASIDGVAALLAAAAASDGVDALVAAAGTEGLSLDVSSGDAPQGQIEMEQNKRETGGFGAIDGVDALLAAAAVSDGVEALLAAAAVSDGVDALLAAAAVSDGVDALLAAADTQGLAPAAGSSQSAGGNKRRNYRHNQEQINAMEIYFKDHPHPDQNQRNDLAMSLGLHPTQVKFWFQNKRTQLKNQSEHEKKVALLSENSMLRAEIQHSTEALRRSRCHECSGSLMDQENNLRRENIRLKEELEMRKSILANLLHGQNPQDLPKELQQYTSELSQNGANLSFPHHKNA
ncbi:homeobox-leucine zipper protein ROC1-like [Daucus carota subsp. sativus]|uniref:homeobox-leucine zipper protein ROC1-like n=1 Tax=Daucus carota subsp. sativus TaxID=79200 RepID=UPI0030834850